MNGNKFLLDTCTLIGLQKQDAHALALIQQTNAQMHQCAISLVTYMEFVGFHGVDSGTAAQLEFIARQFTRLPIGETVASHTIAIRRVHKIKLPDALILATAKAHNLQLITLDEKLARIAGVVLED